VKEKPDILGTQGSEAGDVAKGTASTAGWNGVERRKLQSKRWYDKISWKQLESRITDMVSLVFLQNRAEEIIGLSATSYSVSETGGSLTLTFTRVNPRPGQVLSSVSLQNQSQQFATCTTCLQRMVHRSPSRLDRPLFRGR
jgi:hypothetical protein